MAAVRSECRGEVSAGIEAVFAYISDVSRWPEWAQDIRECSISGGGPLRAGSRIDQRVPASGGSTKERVLDVVRVDAPGRIEFTGTYGPCPLRWGFELNAPGVNSTGVLIWVEMERRGAMRAMPAPMLRKGIHDQNAKELARIKAKVEAEVTAGAPAAG